MLQVLCAAADAPDRGHRIAPSSEIRVRSGARPPVMAAAGEIAYLL